MLLPPLLTSACGAGKYCRDGVCVLDCTYPMQDCAALDPDCSSSNISACSFCSRGEGLLSDCTVSPNYLCP